MGRPLNKKFFANTNAVGVGGESVASVAAVTGLSGMTFPAGPFTILAADITAPQITGGAKPVLTFSATSATAGTVAVVSAGSGYTAAPTVTVRGTLSAGTGTATPTATLTTTRVNGIKCETQFAAGDTEITTGDVVKQQGSRRYKVQTSQGTGFFTLVTTEAKAAGEMSIKATDSAGNTYFVAKLTSRKVLLVPAANVHGGTTTIGSQFASGESAKWTFGSAVANTTVTIDNQ
jgi:hypothetical protein